MRKRNLRRLLEWLSPLKRAVERVAQALPAPTPNAANPAEAAARPIRAGMMLLLIVFGIFGLWSAFAPLSSAAVAPGQVVLDSNRKAIQHLEGGIVEEILVREGARVKEGDTLVRLRGTAPKARYESLQLQHFAARAAELRLKSEQAEQDALTFPEEMLKEAEADAKKQETLATQTELFESRRKAYNSQAEALARKMEEYQHDIEGLTTQQQSKASQITLLEEEIETTKKLLAKGYATRPRLLALQRQAEALRGERGQHLSAIARTRQSIAEAEQQAITLKQDTLSRIADETKENQTLLTQLAEQLSASGDVVGRIAVTAPISGFVTSLAVHTVGGVGPARS